MQDLAEDSSLIREVQHHGVPEHFDYTTIGATEDFVVPATNISLPGATETVGSGERPQRAPRDSPHTDALKAVRATLEGRPPPCVGLLTALRTTVSPVLISRFEHMAGDDAEFVLRGGLKVAASSARPIRLTVVAVLVAASTWFVARPTFGRWRPLSTVLWRAVINDGPSDLAADADGVVVTSNAQSVHLLDADARMRWRVAPVDVGARSAGARPRRRRGGWPGLDHLATAIRRRCALVPSDDRTGELGRGRW